MASIGEVTATLKADIGQYVGPMQQAAQATAQIQQSVENASKALIAEGAAGTVAGKGLANAGVGVQALGQQLAAAEGRVTQLQAGFAALGIQAQGREFARATAEVARLKAELAATGNAAPNLGPQLEVPLKKIPAAATNAAATLTHLRGSLTAIASSVAGVPGPVGNLASKLLMFGVGGAVTVGVTAGLAVLGLAFSKFKERAEEIRKPLEDAHQTIHDIMTDVVSEGRAAEAVLNKQIGDLRRQRAEMRRELSGRFSVSDPANIPEAALRGVSTAYAELSDQIANLEGEAKNLNTTLRSQEGLEHATTATNNLTQAEQGRLAGLRDMGRELSANLDLFGGGFLLATIERTQKQLEVQRQLKAELAATAATQQAMREAETEKQVTTTKADASIKDSVRAGQEEALNATRDVASAMARAFTSSFGDQQQSITDRVAASLGSALRAALEKVLAEKIFAGFLNALFGGLFGGGGFLGGLFGGGKSADVSAKFSAPTLAMPALESAGNVIVVPLQNLPAPRSPVEMARDQMHQAVWVETARVAIQNGVNLQPRFR